VLSASTATGATGATDPGSGVTAAPSTGGVAATWGSASVTALIAGAFVTSAQPTATTHHKAITPHRRFSPPIVLQRNDRINFTWSGSPGGNVTADQFSVRWQGKIEAPVSGSYTFQTDSDEGIRVWVNGQLVIDNFTAHTLTTDTSTAIQLTAGTKYDLRVDLYDLSGQAVSILRWKLPGFTSFAVVPRDRLYVN